MIDGEFCAVIMHRALEVDLDPICQRPTDHTRAQVIGVHVARSIVSGPPHVLGAIGVKAWGARWVGVSQHHVGMTGLGHTPTNEIPSLDLLEAR